MNLLCICTGNTCRSPMLAGLLSHALAQHGFAESPRIVSAGIGAQDGEPATSEAVACLAELGIDISAHRSQHISNLDLSAFDAVLCMSEAHAATARSRGAEAKRVMVVDAEHGGVPDPFGGDMSDYRACARVLAHAARIFAEKLPEWSMQTEAAGSDALARARASLDAAHAADPERRDGKAVEQLYAANLERWISMLVRTPSRALLLAANCQHLERWAIPRSAYPADKPGYFAWRRAVHQRQGERAREILSASGCDDSLAARVAQLVAKAAPRGDAEAQALEDAACLVFLESELAGFAAAHADYSREKLIDIIRKSWRKMSANGQRLAATIKLAPALAELVHAATGS